MNLDVEDLTAKQAWNLSQWCSKTAEMLRNLCRSSDRTARNWWENTDIPEQIVSFPRRRDDMHSFADRLETEAFEWAGEAGSLLAQEDGVGPVVSVEAFTRSDENDGPFEGEELMQQSPAVALRFLYDADLVVLLKAIFHRARHSRARRHGPFSRTLKAGGWSPSSRCWWVRSSYWEQIRKALLENGVKLCGPLAHPRKVTHGFFEREQIWDIKKCMWR